MGISLVATAFYLGFQAARDIYLHQESHPNVLAIIGAGVSIIFKEVLYRYTVLAGRRMKSQLVVANAWHHRSDALSSVAVMAGVTLAQIKPSWHIFDAVAALLVSFFILKVGLDILGNTFRELSDTAPNPETMDSIRQCALSTGGVMAVHDLRVRTSGGLHQIEIHIVVDASLTVKEGHRIAKAVEACLVNDIDDVGRAIVHWIRTDSLSGKDFPVKKYGTFSSVSLMRNTCMTTGISKHVKPKSILFRNSIFTFPFRGCGHDRVRHHLAAHTGICCGARCRGLSGWADYRQF